MKPEIDKLFRMEKKSFTYGNFLLQKLKFFKKYERYKFIIKAFCDRTQSFSDGNFPSQNPSFLKKCERYKFVIKAFSNRRKPFSNREIFWRRSPNY